MLDSSLPLTLQYQLKNKLSKRIESGDWLPGCKISSEREICKEYGVSRMTVREVLGDMVRDGMLFRQQGRGTFVASHKFEQTLSSFYSFSEEIRKMGLRPNTKVLDFVTVNDENIREKLGLLETGPFFSITRLRFIGDDLFGWEKSYVPYFLAPDMTKKEVAENGLYNTIQKHSGLRADEAVEQFEAVNCPSEAARLLGVKKDAAILRLIRLTKAKGRSIEYCESLIRGDKYKYMVVLK